MAFLASLGLGFWLRFAAAVAIAIACWVVYEKIEHWCNAACREETALYEKAVKRASDLALMWSAKVDEVEKVSKQRREATNVAFSGLEGRSGRIASGAGVRMGGDVVSLWHDASGAANAAAATGKREAPADPVPATAQVYDERDLAQFFVASAKAYADAYGQWLACVNTYQALFASQGTK